MSTYFIHKKALGHLRLMEPTELERNITRLSFYTLPQLKSFFRVFEDVSDDIGWENYGDFPKEGREAKYILQQLRWHRANRDEMLTLLGQLVTSHNMEMLLKAVSKSESDGFWRIATEGKMLGSEAKKYFGVYYPTADGLLSLCRKEGVGAKMRLSLPDVIRQAMGVDVRAKKEVMDERPKPLKRSAEPAYSEVVSVKPEAVARVLSACDFMLKVHPNGKMGAMDYRRIAQQGPLFELSPISTAAMVKPIASAKIFASVLCNMPSVERAPERFPQITRDLIGHLEDPTYVASLFQDIFKTGDLSASDIDYGGLSTLVKDLLNKLRECVPGKWYNVGAHLESMNSTFNGRLMSRWSWSSYGRSRYASSNIDTWEYIGVPGVRCVLAVLGLFGILNLGVKSGIAQKVLSQYDSVQQFCVTPLGHYALDPEATKPEGVQGYEVPRCRLDEEYPFIYVPEEVAGLYGPYVAKFGKAIGPTRYAVSAETFLSGLSSYTELEERIKMFKNFVDNKVPEVWRELLERVRRRSQGVRAVGQYLCIRLDVENRELMDFVRDSEELRAMCVRGEGGTLFVEYSQYELLRGVFARGGFFFR